MTCETHDDEAVAIHAWRTERLHRLGIPTLVAAHVADVVDWHQVADLVERGCEPLLALEITL